MKKKLIKEKGITLIALVVTIVVLLILAGVTIAMLTGDNGILTQARKAKEETETGTFQEQKKLICTGAKIQKEENILEYLTKEFQKIDSNSKVEDIGSGYYIECKDEEFIYDYDFNEHNVNEGSENDWTYKENEDGTLSLIKYNNIIPNKLVIPNYINNIPVKRIENSIFLANLDLKTVEISYGISEIGSMAFKQCTNLYDIQIPSSVNTIDRQAFYECTQMTEDISNVISNLYGINDNIFYNCQNITGNIKIKDGITSIGGEAFYNCYNLNGYLDIPNSVNNIGAGAFVNCSNLKGNITEVIKNLDSINHSIFFGCGKLTGSINIKEGIQNISSNAFKGCSSLTGNVVLPKTLKKISSNAFENCINLDGKLIVHSNLEAIEGYAFYNCKSLSNIKYYGTESQWNSITIGIHNEILKIINIEYNDI